MIPVLKKLYPEQEDMKKALNTHLQFFNTHQEFAEIILGIDIAMEEKEGIEALEAVSAIKMCIRDRALGADGVLIGRPASQAVIGGMAEGIRIYMEKIQLELKEAMAMSGCKSIQDITRDKVIVTF